MPKVSVIVPIFNVESYLERCLHSLFKQSLDDIEYVFVDDGCEDNSINKLEEILKLYPQRKSQIKIIRHSQNRGIAAARSTGIKASTGEYLIHCDPDDYVEEDIYEKLYNAARLNNSDIAVCDFYIKTDDDIYISRCSIENTPHDYLITGIKTQFGYASVINKLIKREIIDKYSILPFEGCNYGEDLGLILRILYYAQSITFVNEPLYYYCKREDSLSTLKIDENRINNFILLAQYIEEFMKDKEFHYLSNSFKFTIKFLVRDYYKGKDKEWFYLFRECRKDIFLFDDNSFKVRLLWFFALKNYYLYRFLKKIFSI